MVTSEPTERWSSDVAGRDRLHGREAGVIFLPSLAGEADVRLKIKVVRQRGPSQLQARRRMLPPQSRRWTSHVTGRTVFCCRLPLAPGTRWVQAASLASTTLNRRTVMAENGNTQAGPTLPKRRDFLVGLGAVVGGTLTAPHGLAD